MSGLVLVDAGPLIALSQVEALHLLRDLFDQISTSEQVCTEVLGAPHPGQDALRAATAQGWLRIHEVDLASWKAHRAGIDPGEASIQHLATAHPGSLLIVDDRAARLEASARGFEVIGTAAIVALAKSRGLITKAAPLLSAMRLAGYFLGDDVVAAILARLGEQP